MRGIWLGIRGLVRSYVKLSITKIRAVRCVWVTIGPSGYLSRYTDGLRLDGRGSIPCKGKSWFSTPQSPDRLWGPPSLLYNGYRGSSLGVKRPGREADHSLPSSAEVKNGGAIPLLPRMSLWHSSELIKHSDNFIVAASFLRQIIQCGPNTKDRELFIYSAFLLKNQT
jgi:hypothetical protein